MNAKQAADAKADAADKAKADAAAAKAKADAEERAKRNPPIAESADYNAAYNTMLLAAHNEYRVAHQVGEMTFDAAAAKAA